MSATPNIFSFATSELSQDAFLCWMASLAGAEDEAARQVGQAFITWLWRSARGDARESASAPGGVELQGEPERQKHHADVTFVAAVDGAPCRFVIEDKTTASQHGDQLRRYARAFSEPSQTLIYFKTGYHFERDTAAANAGYAVIGLEEWVGFLDGIELKHDVFRDYRAWMRRQLEERRAAMARLWTAEGYTELSRADAQHAFLRALQERCAPLSPKQPTRIANGVSLGGTPWANLDFAWFSDALPGGIQETLLHRIHVRGGSLYLATRQYARVKYHAEARRAKLERLLAQRRAFDAATAAANTGLKFGKRAGDHRGKNESDVGVLFFNSTENTTTAVLKWFPRVHEAIVERLRGAGL